MSKLDELFQEKLNNHSVTPPAGAWQKIEAGLTKRNKPVLWLRWAAVFLLGGLLLSVLWLRREEAPVTITEKKSLIQPKQETPSKVYVAKQEPEVRNSPMKKKNSHPQTQPAVTNEDKITTEVAGIDQEESNFTEALPTLTTAEPAPIVLVYTLDPVETAVAPVVAASSEKKDSSLKRVLEFASTVKNGDSPLDNLRNAKEELFALDFKKKNNSKKH
jgi:hypothetical protein